MDKKPFPSQTDIVPYCFLALIGVGIITAIMASIGRDTLGEAVIALLYLLPISWITARWGRYPGICAALAAALAFDFFFIPPFYTLSIGRIEGWLVLIIFLVVAGVIVDRIQSGYSRAVVREKEAIFMYELSAALAGASTPEAVARTIALQLQQLYQATLVRVTVQADERAPAIVVLEPQHGQAEGRPGCVLPIMSQRGMSGEICLWKGVSELPPPENRLLQNFAMQSAAALERARLAQAQIEST